MTICSNIKLLLLGLLVFSKLAIAADLLEQWQSQPWMQADPQLPNPLPSRILSISDLPPVDANTTVQDVIDAKNIARNAGSNGAFLAFSWPSLNPAEGVFEFEQLKDLVEFSSGQRIFLGIQIINTTQIDLPADLEGMSLDDPEVISRFISLIDALGPFLNNRVGYLSIGNEVNVYLESNPIELIQFKTFFEQTRAHAKRLAPNLLVGTTLSEESEYLGVFTSLTENSDGHFFTYYHSQQGLGISGFADPAQAKSRILNLAASLDSRPIIFQEVGYPSDPSLTSPMQQELFISQVFDAWEELGGRMSFLNFFLLFDPSDQTANSLADYYNMDEYSDLFLRFYKSLGLIENNGTPKPAWTTFVEKAKHLKALKAPINLRAG